MTLIEALAFIDSEIVTRTAYGVALSKKKPPTPEWTMELERERLRKFYALRDAIKAGLIADMNAKST